MTDKSKLIAAILVAALGYFVDIYDLLLFSIVRVSSLKDLGLSGEELTNTGIFLLDVQMCGMLIGGIAWGIWGDRKGRLSVLFGSILMYSIANIANGLTHSVTGYAVWRFVAGLGLAGELGCRYHTGCRTDAKRENVVMQPCLLLLLASPVRWWLILCQIFFPGVLLS
jgi:MFS family permease